MLAPQTRRLDERSDAVDVVIVGRFKLLFVYEAIGGVPPRVRKHARRRRHTRYSTPVRRINASMPVPPLFVS